MKITVFSDVKPCNPVDVCQCFGGIGCLHLQDRSISQMWKEVVWMDIVGRAAGIAALN